MPPLFLYLLKANIALIAFYLAYYIGLKRLTFYILNRCFLIFGIVFSAIYPALNVNNLFQHHQQLTTRAIYYFQSVELANRSSAFTIWTALNLLFWAGVILMSSRFIGQLISLRKLHKTSAPSSIKNRKVRITRQDINPFSFFNNIYINPSLYSVTESEAIMQHEWVHVSQWHTLDVLMAEMNIIFYWFNPGAWLMKNAVKQNLEFIADRKVLKSGADSTSYQYSLVNATVNKHSVALANNFNLAHLKNRIVMMNKKRSSAANLVKYLLLLPLVVLMLVFTISNAQVHKAKKEKIHAGAMVSKKINDSIPQNQSIIITDINYNNNNDSATAQVKNTVHVKPFVVRDDSIVTININTNDSTAEKGRTYAYSYRVNNDDNTAYAVNEATAAGRSDSVKNVIFLNHTVSSPQTISIHSKNRVMTAYAINSKVSSTSITVTQDTILVTGNEHPLYFVDGKEVSSIKGIDPSKIESVEVLKDKSAVEKYGDKAKNGVVEIYLKSN